MEEQIETVGYVLASKRRVVEVLTPFVEEGLRSLHGEDWFKKENDRRQTYNITVAPKNKVPELKRRPNSQAVSWGFTDILRTMAADTNWNGVFEKKFKVRDHSERQEVRNALFGLPKLRNIASHDEEADEPLSKEQTERYFELIKRLLRRVDVPEAAQLLADITRIVDKLVPAVGQTQPKSVRLACHVDSIIAVPQAGEAIAALYRIDDIPAKIKQSMIKSISSTLLARGWNLSELEHGIGCTFADFNVKLVTDPILLSFTCLPSEWLAYRDNFADDLRVFAISQKQEQMFNEAKIRLASDFVGLDQAEVRIQRTDYLSSIMTDQLAWRRIRSKALAPDGMSAERVIWDGASEFVWEDGRNGARLKGFAEAQVSNQLGASTLAFSHDGHLMLIVQNDKNRQSANLLAPTGSGSLDWDDVKNCGSHDFLQLVRFGAERELREEASLNEHGGERKIDSQVMVFGFARILHRAGKPEFFLIGKIDAVAQEICDRRKEQYVQRVLTSGVEPLNWKSAHLAGDLIRVCSDYLKRTYLDSRAQRIGLSYPLEHSLRILIDVCRNEAAASKIEAFLAGR